MERFEDQTGEKGIEPCLVIGKKEKRDAAQEIIEETGRSIERRPVHPG